MLTVPQITEMDVMSKTTTGVVDNITADSEEKLITSPINTMTWLIMLWTNLR